MESTEVAGLTVSRLVLGTMNIGDTVDADTAACMLDAAAERGRLDADVVTRCDEVWADLRGPAPAYNR